MRTPIIASTLCLMAIAIRSGVTFASHGQDVAIVDAVKGGLCEICLGKSRVGASLVKGSRLKAEDRVLCRTGSELAATYIETSGRFTIRGPSCQMIGEAGSREPEDMKQQRQGRDCMQALSSPKSEINTPALQCR